VHRGTVVHDDRVGAGGEDVDLLAGRVVERDVEAVVRPDDRGQRRRLRAGRAGERAHQQRNDHDRPAEH
jgi:hypothetical protein